LYHLVVRAVFLWTEPSSYLCNLIDLICLILKGWEDIVDPLVLLLEQNINYELK